MKTGEVKENSSGAGGSVKQKRSFKTLKVHPPVPLDESSDFDDDDGGPQMEIMSPDFNKEFESMVDNHVASFNQRQNIQSILSKHSDEREQTWY